VGSAGAAVNVDVIIPARDEAAVVGIVVRSLPRGLVREVIVVDNGSTDATALVAASAGARVVSEPRRGYGSACLAGIAALRLDSDVVAFLDADGSDDVTRFADLLRPIADDHADLVVGARTAALAEAGALLPQQRVGSVVAGCWLRWVYGLPATDLGPFRIIRRQALDRLGMRDRGYGWTVEMQIRAARCGLRYQEIAVASLPRRAGRSKVAGTLRGTFGASLKIVALLGRHGVGAGAGRRRPAPAALAPVVEVRAANDANGAPQRPRPVP